MPVIGPCAERLKQLAFAAFLSCQMHPGGAWAQAGPGTSAAAGAEPMVLAVSLNTEGKGDFFVHRTAEGDFLAKTSDLIAMGFVAPTGSTTMLEGEPHISLRSMSGLVFSFNERKLTLDITADPRLMPTNALDLGSRRRRAPSEMSGNSGFFNYAIDHVTGSASVRGATNFTGEWGARLGPYLLLTDANTVHDSTGRASLVRLASSIMRDDVNTLRRYVVGDFFAGSHELGNGGSFGGVTVRKLYELDPYLNRYPSYTLSGVAALPSELEIYVDGQKIRTERVRPGTFELRDLTGYGGARSVQILMRDPFGRVQEITYPLYFTNQPLRQGLDEYSYSLGALRRNLGLRSNDYGPTAFAMYHRYGVSNALTLGARAEGTRELLNAGPLATVVMGAGGVMNLALAGSTVAGTRGYAALFGYSYQSRDWNLAASSRWESRRFAALGNPVTVSGRKFDGNVSVSYNFRDRGTMSLSHSVLIGHAGQQASAGSPAEPFKIQSLQNRRDTSVTYAVPILAGKANLLATLTHTKEQEQSRNEMFFSLNFNLDRDRRMVASYQQVQDSRVASIQLGRAQPLGEGLGYNLQASHSQQPDGMQLRMSTSLQYNASAAVFRAEYGHVLNRGQIASADSTYRVSLAGGAVYVGGGFALGRPVTDSFALVKTGSLEGVPVTLNGQTMGKTDAQGKLFVPALSSYFDNVIAIRPENMPIDYSFRSISKRVAPPARSGVVLEFEVTRVQGITGMLKYEKDGVRGPLEFQEIVLTANGKKLLLPTGRGGEFYAENLETGNHPGSARIESAACTFTLVVVKSEDPFIDLGDVLCRPVP